MKRAQGAQHQQRREVRAAEEAMAGITPPGAAGGGEGRGGTNAVARLRRRHFARCSACRVESSLSLLSSLQGGFMISWLHHREHDEGDDEGDDLGRRRLCPGFHGGPASHPHFLPCPPVAAQRALQILLVLTNNSL